MHIVSGAIAAVGMIAAAMLLGNGPRCSAMPTPLQLRNIIVEILYEDEQWRDLLSERVRLDGDKVPPLAQDVLSGGQYVDPLVSLHKLMRTPERFSGADLRLATMILDNAVMCLTFKRVAVHIALTIRMVALESEQRTFVTRAMVFANVVPFYADMLSPYERRYEQLLKVFDVVAPVAWQVAERVEKQNYTDRLSGALGTLTEAIGSTCAQSDMREYFKSLRLPAAERLQLTDVIGDDQQISGAVDLAAVVELLQQNENAILDVYDEMYLIKNFGLDTWKSILQYPDLPIEFDRTPLPSYRDTKVKIKQNQSRRSADVIDIDNESDTNRDTPNPL